MLLHELIHLADRPTLEEVLERLESLPRVDVPGGAAAIVREERARR